jgi:Gpi18-like mannosyltransferase
VAENGYERVPFDATTVHNWAFFPLYPAVTSGIASITMGELVLTAVALSNIFFFASLVLLYKLALQLGCDKGLASRAIFYVSVFPTSYFYSVPMTESLFLLLTVGAFYAARGNHWFWASVVGALASATRLSGICLLPSLALGYWEWHRSSSKKNVLFLLLIPVGLLGFMLFLGSVTGDYTAFKDIQVAFGRSGQSGFFLQPLVDFAIHPTIFGLWNLYPLHFASALLALSSATVLAKERSWSLALYTLLSAAIPLSGLSLASLTRYVMVIFPIFVLLARRFRSLESDVTIRVVFASMLVMMTACYTAHYGFALA